MQSIVAVSQLVGDMSVTTNPKFQESLALVNNLAASDRGNTKSIALPLPNHIEHQFYDVSNRFYKIVYWDHDCFDLNISPTWED